MFALIMRIYSKREECWKGKFKNFCFQIKNLNNLHSESRNITYKNLLGDLPLPEVSISALAANSYFLVAVTNPCNTRLFLITANIISALFRISVLQWKALLAELSPDIICQDPNGCCVYFTDTIEAYSWMYYQIEETNSARKENYGRFLNSEVTSPGTCITRRIWTLQLDDGNVFRFFNDQNGQAMIKSFRLSDPCYESSLEEKGKHHAAGNRSPPFVRFLPRP